MVKEVKKIIIILFSLLALPSVAGAQPIVFQLPRKVEKKAHKWILF